MRWTHLNALIVKELLAVLRDPKGRIILILPPLLQIIVFSNAATLEVTDIDVMVLNRDRGRWGYELVQRIQGSPAFGNTSLTNAPNELHEAIDRQFAIAAIQVSPSFSRDIEAGRPTQVQVILDGRRANASQIVAGYLNQIVSGLSASTPSGQHIVSKFISVVPRNWFNPNLIYQWFMVPNLIGSIALLIGLTVTALSIAREHELGTFDQLVVSPLRTHEILIGKLVPPMLIGMVHITLYILAAVVIFGIPLRGSLLLLYGSSLFFMASVVGLGLFISALSKTQQQAILGAFLVLVPATLLSGIATPVENMPVWLQPVTYLNPLRYYLTIVRGVFLKDLPAAEVLQLTAPMAIIAAFSLVAGAWRFRARLG